ncbi:MAG: retropepsin-like domain-containing protein [Solirubrobacterales bacterium]|nr:retropepsin-like domain-containing protein [Solirubrobacterales bacterium]
MAVVAAAIALASCGGSSGAGGTTSSSATSSAPVGGSSAASSTAARTIPIPTFALPSKAAGCHGARPAGGGAIRIPARVSKVGPNVGILVNVCIEGKGPFPFAVDTGASKVTINAELADRLKLPRVGSSETFRGAGCTGEGQERRITSWSVAGVPLRGQTATGANLPDFGGAGQPDGLIGSDVWGAFGAVRIDFAHGDLVVPGHEGPPPRKEALIKKPAGSPLPAGLVSGRPRLVAPMSVEAGPTQTIIVVGVAFGAHPVVTFTPDTGASTSVVDSSVAKHAGLVPVEIKERQNTVCSVATAPEVESGAWSLAGKPLLPQSIATANLLASGVAAGLLGADQMSHYGSVIFDYRGGQLVLGAG